jgi:hypothetical protein
MLQLKKEGDLRGHSTTDNFNYPKGSAVLLTCGGSNCIDLSQAFAATTDCNDEEDAFKEIYHP